MQLFLLILCIMSISSSVSLTNSFKKITGIYLHIPFCRRRCYYCDFPIKIVGESKSTQKTASQQYTSYLLKEIQATHNLLEQTGLSSGDSVEVDTIYFGGGTPSLLDNESVETILKSLRKYFTVVEKPEITFEMDPGTFDYTRVIHLQNLGINRVSMGIQSFDEKFLKLCGRAHTVKDIHQAVKDLQRANFINYNVDLISSLPHQDQESWLSTLKGAIATDPTHISIYDLQIEEKTAFGRWYTPGVFPLPTDEQARDFYSKGVETLTRAGFEHYEISNYAKKGYRSAHNQKYWKCLPTLGFGMGAASYVNGVRHTRPHRLEDYYKWTEVIEKDPDQLTEIFGTQIDDRDTLIPDLLDVVMLSLRTADGLDLHRIDQVYGNDQTQKILKSIHGYRTSNEVIYSPDKEILRLKDPEGFIISNDIISSIFAALQ